MKRMTWSVMVGLTVLIGLAGCGESTTEPENVRSALVDCSPLGEGWGDWNGSCTQCGLQDWTDVKGNTIHGLAVNRWVSPVACIKPTHQYWPMPSLGYTHSASNYDTTTKPGTIIDRSTKLMWKNADEVWTGAWSDGISKCKGISFAGYSDWRVPSRIELESLVDYDNSGSGNKINPVMNMSYVGYWSSSSSGTSPNASPQAWYVSFDYGASYPHNGSSGTAIRCVR